MVLTGGKNNSQIKLWHNKSMACLQTINLELIEGLPSLTLNTYAISEELAALSASTSATPLTSFYELQFDPTYQILFVTNKAGKSFSVFHLRQPVQLVCYTCIRSKIAISKMIHGTFPPLDSTISLNLMSVSRRGRPNMCDRVR